MTSVPLSSLYEKTIVIQRRIDTLGERYYDGLIDEWIVIYSS